MELPIPNKLEKLWDTWDIPSCILLSLWLQVFLVLFASLRQRIRNAFLGILIWSAYMIADWVAAVTIGLITKVQVQTDHPFRDRRLGNEDLYAFWASFLLLHLGGPDTITSFALEDNEFWVRHLFGLILQVIGAAYCIFLTLPNNNLWLPTILVFVAGSVKYAERTMALYLASLDHFQNTVPDFGDPNNEQPEPEPEPEPVAGFEGPNAEPELEPEPEPKPEPEPVAGFEGPNAETKPEPETEPGPKPEPGPEPVAGFEGPNAEPELEPKPGGTKFDFNLALEPNHIELLMVSYTLFKIFKGIIFGNFRSSKLAKSSRKLFLQIKHPKVGFKLIEYELSLMYEVLHTKVAAVRSRIGLVFRLSSFCFIVGAFISFRFVVKDGDHHEFGGFEMSLTYALLIGAVGLDTISGIKLIFSDWIVVSNGFKRWRKFIPECVLKRRRWCGSVPQYNMIDYCLDERWIWKCNKFPDCFRVMIDNIKFILFSSSSSVDDTEELMCFIFERLTQGSREGESIFDTMISINKNEVSFVLDRLLLQFHLGTEICYHLQTETELESCTDEIKRARRMSKLISDYFFYLLIMKPEVLGVKGNWKKVLHDTFAEAQLELMENKIYDNVKARNHFMDYAKENMPVSRPHRNVKKASSKNLLLGACKAAEQIQSMEWNKTTEKWIQILYLATINCRPMLHAQQPSRGGELFTFIRFLIYHL